MGNVNEVNQGFGLLKNDLKKINSKSFYSRKLTLSSSPNYQRGHCKKLPPSTGRHAPVMNEAESEAKKAIAEATSSTTP